MTREKDSVTACTSARGVTVHVTYVLYVWARAQAVPAGWTAAWQLVLVWQPGVPGA